MFQKRYQKRNLWTIDGFFILFQPVSMLYMIIEKFHAGKVRSIYERYAEKGRLMPHGVKYINSWITKDMNTCYQVMESISGEKIYEWINNWNDLSDFEIITACVIDQLDELRIDTWKPKQ